MQRLKSTRAGKGIIFVSSCADNTVVRNEQQEGVYCFSHKGDTPDSIRESIVRAHMGYSFTVNMY